MNARMGLMIDVVHFRTRSDSKTGVCPGHRVSPPSADGLAFCGVGETAR